MMGFIQGKVFGMIVGKILDEIVTEENYNIVMDKVLDFFEDLAAGTDTSIDDIAVAKIRQILKVPDLPDE